MKRWLLISALILESLGMNVPGLAQASFSGPLLRLHRSVRERLGPGEHDTWGVLVRDGHSAVVEIRQQEVDVRVLLFDPQGVVRVEIDETGAPDAETILWVAQSEGTWQVRVEPFEPSQGGNYEIELVASRPATPADRNAWEASLLDREVAERLAEGMSEEVRALIARLVSLQETALSREPATLAASWTDLALRVRDAGDPDLAAQLLEKAVERLDSQVEPDPDQLAKTLVHLGDLRARHPESPDAERSYLRAIALWEPLPSEHRSLSVALSKLGTFYRVRGRYSDAERLYERALAVLRSLPNPLPMDLAFLFNNLGTLWFDMGRYSQAEESFKKALEIKKRELGEGSPVVASELYNLAELYRNQARFAEAEPLARQALDIFGRELGAKDPKTLKALNILALLEIDLSHYREAEALLRQALDSLPPTLTGNRLDRAGFSNNLGELLIHLGRPEEAEGLIRSALEIREAVLDRGHPDVASSLESLARLEKSRGRYRDALPLLERARAIREVALSPDHPDVALSLNDLADLLMTLGRYTEAESLLRRALKICENAFGMDHPRVAAELDNLAVLLKLEGRPSEAERLLDQSLLIRRRALGEKSSGLAPSLNNLGAVYDDQARYGEALIAYRRALEILEEALGKQHPQYGISLQNLAAAFAGQGRLEEAESFYQRSLETLKPSLGSDHPTVANVLDNLGSLVNLEGRPREAEQFLRRALAIREATFGEGHPDVASSLQGLAAVAFVQSKDAEVEDLLRRSLALLERALGPEHPEVAKTLGNLAFFLQVSDRLPEAGPLIERAIRILEKIPLDPERKVSLYGLRARQRKAAGKTAEAQSALAQALDTAERLRPGVGGSEETQAVFLAQYADLFHEMVTWQIEAGRIEQAVDYAERRRARVLLDQLASTGVDWRQSLPAGSDSLLRREAAARARLAEHQQRVRLNATMEEIELLRQAETDYAEVYEEVKNASSVHNRVEPNSLVDLATIQRDLVPSRGLLLLYEIGFKESFVFVVPPSGQKPVALSLRVSPEVGQVLGLPPGDLTADGLRVVMRGDARPGGNEGPGLFSELSRTSRDGIEVFFPPEVELAFPRKLQALWQALVPEDLRTRLLACEEVVLIPDSDLHLLPFEALVLEIGPQPDRIVYWLDRGPVVRYAPSLTTLAFLESPQSPEGSTRPAGEVLSLSDPIYDPAEVARLLQRQESGSTAAWPGESSAAVRQAAFLLREGPLPRLPGTAREREAILEVFGAESVRVLKETGATEAALRAALPGWRYLSLATHGVVDQRRNHLFASLVLTPPPGETATAEDDGLLQLHEIYDLSLQGCELAVLSACRTNIGHNVEGEGVFALSRGFLVAGARRVVASQWSVDDASTAVLMGELFRQRKSGVGYAQALRAAQTKIRRLHPEPYYWAPFVLMGAD